MWNIELGGTQAQRRAPFASGEKTACRYISGDEIKRMMWVGRVRLGARAVGAKGGSGGTTPVMQVMHPQVGEISIDEVIPDAGILDEVAAAFVDLERLSSARTMWSLTTFRAARRRR